MPYTDLLKGRYSQAGQIYFVTTIVAERRPAFSDFGAGRLAVREMQRLQLDGAVGSLAWVLMPDHLHWLIQLQETQDLARIMNSFKGRSAIALNRYLGREGRFWQSGFHDHALRREEDLQSVPRYVVANPLRAGLVRRLGDYPHWDAVWVAQ